MKKVRKSIKVKNRVHFKTERDSMFAYWLGMGMTEQQAGIAAGQSASIIPEGLDKGLDITLDAEDLQLLGKHAGRRVTVAVGYNSSF